MLREGERGGKTVCRGRQLSQCLPTLTIFSDAVLIADGLLPSYASVQRSGKILTTCIGPVSVTDVEGSEIASVEVGWFW